MFVEPCSEPVCTQDKAPQKTTSNMCVYVCVCVCVCVCVFVYMLW